jgi:flagellar protein FliO/FliZ
MGFLDFLRAILALSVTLGLIGLAAWALRRYAPGLMARLQSRSGRQRRLEVVETLVLDPSRRLLLVRVGGEDRLLLLGEGRELAPPPPDSTGERS